MAKITGKTFEHRETLRRYCNWDGNGKFWRIADDHPKLNDFRNLPGVIVTLDGSKVVNPNPDAKPAPKPEQDFDRSAVSPYKGGVYGNDMTYQGKFGPTTVFAGFDSLDAMVSFVENINPNDLRTRGRRAAWRRDNDEWYGSLGMADAIRIARDGWADGVEKARVALDVIEADNPTMRQRKHTVAGGTVNVGRMLTGNPLHMQKRTRQPARKVITLFSQTRLASIVEPETAIIRAASVAAMADILEQHDYSCEIVAYSSTRHETFRSHFAVRVKHAGETLNLQNVVFALGHPSMYRRFGFALNGIDDLAQPICTNAHGYMDAIKTDAPNEFVVAEPPPFFEFNSFRFADKVRELFPTIVPDNFPVTLK